MAIIEFFIYYITKQCWFQSFLGILILILVSLLLQVILGHLILNIANRLLFFGGHDDWNNSLVKHNIYKYIRCLVPLFVVSGGIGLIPHIDKFADLVGRLARASVCICFFLILGGILSVVQDRYSFSTMAQTRSIKGYIQIGKLLLAVICIILVLSILIDRSPLLMISGLGALSAVLLLVFKDTLLSLVASTQLISNDMLRIGDWIEMPQSNADGFVRDIALHTVKVQNWDNTFTTVPTYKLFSESYRNYRQMFESGGRRIKRSINIDIKSIKFLNFNEIRYLMHFKLLDGYFNSRSHELGSLDCNYDNLDKTDKTNITNISIFRHYALAFLKSHHELRKDMTMVVRMLDPKPEGVPLEIYCFTSLTAWIEHERIQGDVFDHLITILPEFKLLMYQKPSGSDFVNFRCIA
ncbi:mechanosensitive ion channel protein [Candidatus Kinetoplastibacterium blastocrithidii TCC012E]|uniref:Mechanosensitive ion channel protein n=1 Tax=Candidatus Kinetoplastidibacterium blastocrithidiae TCC012E TaxID=1208922 RepID=M1MDC8_9PROT|nr:mechanosensitive ion channel domain-containing protein [Candidatus Kinetoplastibacterium blastocrithidii]AFZ83614.1 mechanosensitive channel protein [Candidatus Kinetoplastibacterium blastocrithidii (ex Strigomonas culicis)]AGF49735.1 mechanosensitive ion channel protein [Candidatus Kinetoplastibacterium blastocrithidii TCC012E]